MKIIYIGCVESSYFFLEALLEAGANVIGVITKKNSKYNSDFKDISPICKINCPLCQGHFELV